MVLIRATPVRAFFLSIAFFGILAPGKTEEAIAEAAATAEAEREKALDPIASLDAELTGQHCVSYNA